MLLFSEERKILCFIEVKHEGQLFCENVEVLGNRRGVFFFFFLASKILFLSTQ